MNKDKMLEYVRYLRSDLKYALEKGEAQIPNYKDVNAIYWLIEQAEKFEELQEITKELINCSRDLENNRD